MSRNFCSASRIWMIGFDHGRAFLEDRVDDGEGVCCSVRPSCSARVTIASASGCQLLLPAGGAAEAVGLTRTRMPVPRTRSSTPSASSRAYAFETVIMLTSRSAASCRMLGSIARPASTAGRQGADLIHQSADRSARRRGLDFELERGAGHGRETC